RYSEGVASWLGPSWLLDKLSRLGRSRRANEVAAQASQPFSALGATLIAALALGALGTAVIGDHRSDLAKSGGFSPNLRAGSDPSDKLGLHAGGGAGPLITPAGVRAVQAGPGPRTYGTYGLDSGTGVVLQSILAPGSKAQQSDAVFTSLTPSPNYQRD